MAGSRPRVLLADDHPMMLRALRKLLEPEYEVVGEATDGRALVEAAERLQPDLILTDISMPELDGLEATRRLVAVAPRAAVLILSIHTEPSWIRAAFAAGARGYLPKTAAPEEIETAIEEVCKGGVYVSPTAAQAMITALREPSPEPLRGRPAHRPLQAEALTPREQDIVRLVGRGLCNKEIAQELGVSVTTVRTHLHRVYEKLGPESRVELALYAAQGGEAVM